MKLRERHLKGIEGKLILVAMTLGLLAVTIMILANGFMLDEATKRWALVISTLGAAQIAVQNLTFLQPHFPLYVLMPFYYIPGLDTGAAPYLISVLCATLLLFMWDRDLREVEFSPFRHVTLALLIIIHPCFLWAATSGGYLIMSMIAFYLLYRGCQHIISEHDIHSYIMLAVVFMVYFFVDSAAIFIFVALLPLIVVVAPIRTVMVSPSGLYLIVGTPLAFAIGTWAYMNWIFEGSFLHFITNADSAYLGGKLHIEEFPWLMQYGGQLLMPFLAVAGYMLVAYPVSIYLLLDTIDNGYRFRASFVLLLHPLVAVAIATSQEYLSHPFEILSLISAGLMAELTYVKMQTRREFVILVLFMMVSVVGGWWLFAETSNAQMKEWMQALQGPVVRTAEEDTDLALGVWLKSNPQPTILFEKYAYKVIAARGNTDNLYLSFSNEFKANLRQRVPDIAQVALPDPHTLRGRKDWVNARFPHMYEYGMTGYRLVYDHLGWRVYRKKSHG